MAYKSENNCDWIYYEKKTVSSDIIKAAGSKILAQLLVNRGINTAEKVKEFLNPEDVQISSPYVFEDMIKAVELINKLIESQEHIVIYGDFDADGVTSTSLLFKTLKYIGANVSYFIPDRADEGHGLSSASLCRLISLKKAKLVITVDCGISNISEVSLAKGLGTEVIITDHHEAPELLPSAYAIINPKLFEEDSDLKYLAGVGVIFKLACALLESHNKEEYIENLFPLVAVGSIADIVPLLGENRTLVAKGLKLISFDRCPGLFKLLESAGCKTDNISAESIAFGVAPRINAIGRLSEASSAVDLLISENLEEVDILVKKLNSSNKIRQQMCDSTFAEAVAMIDSDPAFEEDGAVILSSTNWHPGIIGIVASKIVEKYYKPAFLISIDEENKEARCSARSIEGVNLHKVLSSHSDLFDKFGGHYFAAGFSFDLGKYSLEKVKNSLLSSVSGVSGPESFRSRLNIDVDMDLRDLSIELVEEINKLSPFGEGNPSPVFSVSNVTLKQFKTMGSANNHLKIFLSDDDNVIEAVWWQKSDLNLSVLDKIDVAFSPDINTFGGKTKIQLIVKDIRTISSEGSSFSPENHAIESSIEIVEPSISNEEVNDPVSCCKLIDHRKKIGAEKNILNYIKLSKENVSIFAENASSLSFLDLDEFLKSKVMNRLTIRKTDQLVFWDLPSDRETLLNLLENSSPRIIHLIGKSFNGNDPGYLIKTISGMLKFAFTNKEGKINLDQAASFLGISGKVVYSCLNLLKKAGIIKINNESASAIDFDFIGSSDLSSILSLEEYNSFLDSIKTMESFRYKLATLDVDKLQELIVSNK